MKKLAQRTVIASAGVLAIASAVGGTDLLGQARADDPQCVASVTAPCAQQVPPPADPPHRTHIRVFGQPGEAKWGLSAVSSGCHESAGACRAQHRDRGIEQARLTNQ
jgi:hypothetical protein